MSIRDLPDHPSLLLAFDSGSPLTSVAVAREGAVIAEDAVERASSPESLLALIDAVLARCGGTPADIDAICVLAGPGSFTGLRIGLATALGLHHALGVRAAAMPTLRVLAEASDGDARRVIAVVDAMRGEWFAQAFLRSSTMVEEGAPRILRPEQLAALEPEVVIGFGASRLAETAGLVDVVARDPPPLARVAARLGARWQNWDPGLLTHPLYLRSAATTPSARR